MKRGRPSIWALAQNSLELEARKHNRSRRTFTRYLRVLAYGVPELIELVKTHKLKISAAEVIARRLTPDQQRVVVSRGVPAIVRVAGLIRRGIRGTPIARERQIFRIAEFLVTRLGRHGVRKFAGQ